MAFEQRELTGSIFKNNKKEEDKHPDMTGSALIDGKQYWVSGWKKVDKNDNIWISLSFQDKNDQSKPVKSALPKSDEFEDDIPF